MNHLVTLLKLCSTLNNAVSCFAERSSSNKAQQRVSDGSTLLAFFLFSCFFSLLKLELANYYSSGKKGA